MGTDRDDRLRPGVVREQEGDVLARPGRGDRAGAETERIEPREARSAPVRVGVDDEFRRRAMACREAERLVGDAVHVADDEVGSVARLDQCVGPAVDADEDGAGVADPWDEGGEVLPIPRAADDDEDGATLHAMAEFRQPGTSEQEIALALHVLDGVPREALEPLAELFAGRPRRLGDRRRRERDPDGDDTIIHDDAVALDAHRCAVGDLAESERPDPIDEWDTCVREDGGAEVRVAPRDRRGGVHDRGGARGHERFRRDPVEVLVIDDRHIARSEPLDEPFRAGPDARQCLGLDGSARAPRTRPDHHSASRRASRRGRGGSAYRAALSGRSPRRSASPSPLRR